MATAPNPMMGAGGAPGGGGISSLLPVIMGALSNKASTNPGQQFSEQSAAVQGADPTMILRQLEQVNSLLGTLFIKTFQNMPNVANNISKTMSALSRAIKEGQQASNIGEAISKQEQSQSPPITFSAAQQGQNAPQPDMGAQ